MPTAYACYNKCCLESTNSPKTKGWVPCHSTSQLLRKGQTTFFYPIKPNLILMSVQLRSCKRGSGNWLSCMTHMSSVSHVLGKWSVCGVVTATAFLGLGPTVSSSTQCSVLASEGCPAAHHAPRCAWRHPHMGLTLCHFPSVLIALIHLCWSTLKKALEAVIQQVYFGVECVFLECWL